MIIGEGGKMHFLPLSKQHLILKVGKNTKTARNKFGPKRTDNISILAIISIKKKVKKVKKKKNEATDSGTQRGQRVKMDWIRTT